MSRTLGTSTQLIVSKYIYATPIRLSPYAVIIYEINNNNVVYISWVLCMNGVCRIEFDLIN